MHPTSHSFLHFANDTPNHFDPPVTRAKLGSLGNQIRNRETRGRLVMADSTRTRSNFKCLGCSSSGGTRFVPFYRQSTFTIESAIYTCAPVLMYEHRPSIKLRGRANHFSRAMPSKSVSPRVISLLHAHNRSIDGSWLVAANCEHRGPSFPARISP